MNRTKRQVKKASIGVESMEGRVVLSTVHAMVLPTQGSLVPGVHSLYLQGSAHGSVNRVVGNPDVGTTVNLHGLAQFPGQGRMQLSGSIHGTGFLANGGLNGTLRLSNGKGSVTLQLQRSPVSGFTAPTSGTYTYSVQGGAGAFTHEIGRGSVDVVLGPRTFLMRFHGMPNNA